MPAVMDTACKPVPVSGFPTNLLTTLFYTDGHDGKKQNFPKEIQLNDNNSANANVNERESELVTDMERF